MGAKLTLPMHLETTHATCTGNRANNEDCAAVAVDGGSVLLVVADGMGGHENGEGASAAAVAALVNAFPGRAAPEVFLRSAFQAAHEAVFVLGAKLPVESRPRTTCVAALLDHRKVWFAHSGDSRAHLVRDGAVVVRTRDHSHVESMVDAGEISSAQVDDHPLRNLVERCLGGERGQVEVELGGPHAVQAGDIVLLCSDGFWDGVDIADAALRLAGAEALSDELERLTEEACDACAPQADNATAAVLRVRG